MTTRICDHPADGLLPWYLNGTLDQEEAAGVARHLKECAICACKREELAQIAAGLSAYGMPPEETRRARASPLPYALAAGLLLPAVLGVSWAYLGFPTNREAGVEVSRAGPKPPHGEALRSTMTLDLGAGPLRGSKEMPTLHLSDSADLITIGFFMPPLVTDRVVVELERGSGEVLAKQPGIPRVDELGRCAYSFSPAILTGPGEYALVVQESLPAGPRSHRFPFRVDRAMRGGSGS